METYAKKVHELFAHHGMCTDVYVCVEPRERINAARAQLIDSVCQNQEAYLSAVASVEVYSNLRVPLSSGHGVLQLESHLGFC